MATQSWIGYLRRLYHQLEKDRVSDGAATLACYTMLALTMYLGPEQILLNIANEFADELTAAQNEAAVQRGSFADHVGGVGYFPGAVDVLTVIV